MLKFITEKQEWKETLNALPEFIGKVYCLYEYFEALQANQEGKPAAILYSEKDAKIFYPFLLKKIPQNELFYDIESPYGYAGHICFNCNKTNINKFCDEFVEFAIKNNIVAEFIRYNPFYKISQYFDNNGYTIALNRKTVSMDLSNGFEKVIENCSSARKRNYKRGLKNLNCEISNCNKALSNFKNIYFQNMKRLNAEKYYYFSDEYFSQLMLIPDDNFKIMTVKTHSGIPVASGIFLFDKLSAHYHLGASDMSFKEYQPSVFMIMCAAKFSCEQNKNLLHLGGGLSLDKTDSLFRFKSGFSPIENEFYIGKKIYNSEKYKNFSDEWAKKTGKSSVKLLHYHDI